MYREREGWGRKRGKTLTGKNNREKDLLPFQGPTEAREMESVPVWPKPKAA